VLATREQTDGQFGIVMLLNKAGEGPGPAITHSLEAESWYVVEGNYEFHIGDRVFEGGPGTFVSVDAGQPHGHIAKTDGKLLVLFQPGGYENFFMEWNETQVPKGPEAGKLEEKYGVTRPPR
jgi:quercetin dioxygenase-like cupin family protein